MIAFALLFLAALSPQPAQTYRLESGDYQGIRFVVRQIPTEVDCHFEVGTGGATVHAELLSMNEFRRLDRGRPHEAISLTPDARAGEFRHLIETPGPYVAVIANAKDAEPALVSFTVETTTNPADMSRTLSLERRLTVIGLSVAFFLVTVIWSGRKLMLAMREDR
jgi:hypothetical protein